MRDIREVAKHRSLTNGCRLHSKPAGMVCKARELLTATPLVMQEHKRLSISRNPDKHGGHMLEDTPGPGVTAEAVIEPELYWKDSRRAHLNTLLSYLQDSLQVALQTA